MSSRWWRRHYGASPLHLAALAACFGLAGYVVHLVLDAPLGVRILLWFAGAVAVHDVVLWPLYTVADRAMTRPGRRGGRPGRGRQPPAVPWINHLRVPAVVSAVLLCVSFPLVFGLSAPTYHAATGLSESPYLGRWLAVTGSLFAASGVIYAVRRLRARPGATPPTCPEQPGTSR